MLGAFAVFGVGGAETATAATALSAATSSYMACSHTSSREDDQLQGPYLPREKWSLKTRRNLRPSREARVLSAPIRARTRRYAASSIATGGKRLTLKSCACAIACRGA